METIEKAAQKIISDMGWDWYETESSARRVAEYCAKKQEEDLHKAYCAGANFDMSCLNGEQYYMFKDWYKQFKRNKMKNLKDKILDTIQNNYETFKGTNEAELQSAEDVTEITIDIAIKFAEWITSTKIEGNYYEHSKDNIWHGQYNPDKRDYNPKTTQELFKEFINNYHGK